MPEAVAIPGVFIIAISVAVAPKSTHEPHQPWFLTGVMKFLPVTLRQSNEARIATALKVSALYAPKFAAEICSCTSNHLMKNDLAGSGLRLQGSDHLELERPCINPLISQQ